MTTLIQTNQIHEGWTKLIQEIMTKGHIINDERGNQTKELLNVIVEIKHPIGKNFYNITDIKTPKNYFWKGDKLKTYSEQFLNKNKQGFIYTYGNRLRDHFNHTDQIQEAINRLNQCQETRRAISITWDQTLDTKNEEVPCLILIDFKIRNNTLYTTALWRSHDIYGAWYPNLVGLTHLTSHVANKTQSKIGNITVQSISAHIYQTDYKQAEKYL